MNDLDSYRDKINNLLEELRKTIDNKKVAEVKNHASFYMTMIIVYGDVDFKSIKFYNDLETAKQKVSEYAKLKSNKIDSLEDKEDYPSGWVEFSDFVGKDVSSNITIRVFYCGIEEE